MNKLLVMFNKKEKKRFVILFFLMIIAAVFETIGIGLIFPFVGIVTNPDMIQEQVILSSIYDYFNFATAKGFTIFAVIFLLSTFVLKYIYLLVFNYSMLRVILNKQVNHTLRLYQSYFNI